MRLFPILALSGLVAGCSALNDGSKADLEASEYDNAMMARDDDADGYPASDDCDDLDANINPGEAELCDSVDNDCDGDIDDDDNGVVENLWAPDYDGDGYTEETGYVFACDVQSLADFVDAAGGDSDNLDYWIQPTIYEDTDGDGYEDMPVWDCDDEDLATNPGATEVCDGADNDCDGDIDSGMPLSTWYADFDTDGYGDPAVSQDECGQPSGYVSDWSDCNDLDANINPGMLEVCDSADTDEDCDGNADDADTDGTSGGETDWYVDADDDGYGSTTWSVANCDGGTNLADNADDCDDTDATVWSESTWYSDYDGDGFGSSTVSFVSCSAPPDYINTDGDCDDSSTTGFGINPDATEVYDSVDNDCDGLIDEDVTCEFRLEIFGDDLSSVWADFSDDTYDGDWVSGVTGISSVSTSLGGDVWYHEFMGDYCFGSETLDVSITFADGTVACDTDLAVGSGTTYATQDGADLFMSNVDSDTDGDGSTDACVLRISE